MKKILLVALVAFTMLSCNQGVTVSFDDPKSQAILSVYDSYMKNDATAIESLYAEDAVVYLNSLDSIPIQENVKNLATQKAEMQTRIQTLEKLVQATQSNGFLRQFSAVRIRGENKISYELLIANPKPGSKERKKKVRIVIRGVENIDPLRPEQAISESIGKTRMRQHKIRVPEVAEAIKGKLESISAKFLIATILPFDDITKSEVIIIPITSI